MCAVSDFGCWGLELCLGLGFRMQTFRAIVGFRVQHLGLRVLGLGVLGEGGEGEASCGAGGRWRV